jgi:hypothetical protein
LVVQSVTALQENAEYPEVEADESTDEKQVAFDGEPNNIEEDIDPLFPCDKEFLNNVRILAEDLSSVSRKHFLTSLSQKRRERKISQKFLDFNIEKELDLPKITITNGKKAQEMLEELGFEDRISPENIILVFQLPKPIANFWWKGKSRLNTSWEKETNGIVLEWGKIYRGLIPTVWELINKYEEEGNLEFWRINEIGEHSADEYYYIWEIGNLKSKTNTQYY